MTLNERSFLLFGDEKILASKQGRQLLHRVGLDFPDLKCYPTRELFFYYRHRSDSVEENILIVENRDTFFSLKKLLQEDIYGWNQISVSLLIYGEQASILTKNQHFNQQVLKDFTGYFTHDWIERIDSLLTDNRYIP